jgi:hypothetical protein
MNEIKSYTKDFMSPRSLRFILLAVITINITMMIIAVSMYPPFLTMPHSVSYILESGIMLFLYIGIVIWATRPAVSPAILRMATFFGVIACLLEIVHISIENFGHMDSHTETISTGIFMLGLFLIFAVSGYRTMLYKRNIIPAMLAGSWSAIVCMLIVTTYGLSQLFWSFGSMEKHNIGNPDFIRTGWTDLHAFVIADIFEACFKILFVGPVAGIIFGLFGAGIAYFFDSQKNNTLCKMNVSF